MKVARKYFEAERLLEQRLKSLGSKFGEMYVTERRPGPPFYEGLNPNGPHYLEWSDNSPVDMDPNTANEALKKIPELVPADQALSQLKTSGYEGFPTVGQFNQNCFAFTTPQGAFLVVGNINRGTYTDELSYLELVRQRLSKRFIDLGVTEPRASLQISNYPGISTKLSSNNFINLTPDPNRVMGREASLKFLMSYEDPEALRQPKKLEVFNAISQMPELDLAKNKIAELKLAGYDGWDDVGSYPDDVYVLDITKMSNHISDPKYPTLMLFHIYNSSKAVIPLPWELDVQGEINKRLAATGLNPGGVGISSDEGPSGPNYFTMSYNGYSPPEHIVKAALSAIPEVSLKGHIAFFDISNIPALAHVKQTLIPIHLTENVQAW